MFPVELIPELREHIVSFLGPWDEIASFSLTCHQAVETVEAYSRRELDRIEREHDVDDTWRFRIGMQAAQDAAARLLSSEGEQRQEGVMLVPNNISHRRMLRSAYRTYLYSLGTTTHSRDWTSLLALSIHPNGKYLLTGGHGRPGSDPCVRLWDLSTKQCIRSFIGHEWFVDNVRFSAGHVVSSSISDNKVRIWSMDGVCKHVIGLPEPCTARSVTVSNDMVYTMLMNGSIYAINTVAGTMSLLDQPRGDISVYPMDLQVCKNYLLSMRSDADVRDAYSRYNGLGIYVFDRDTKDLRSYLVGNYCSMRSISDGDVALTTVHGQIQVYQLQDGSLVPRLSVRVSGPGGHNEVLGMTKSSIFVKEESRGRTQSRIAVYSSINGVLERKLCFPTAVPAAGATYSPWAMTSTEKEVFVGFNVGGETRAGGTVKAYLL